MSILILILKWSAVVFLVSLAAALFMGKFIEIGQGKRRAEPQDDDERV